MTRRRAAFWGLAVVAAIGAAIAIRPDAESRELSVEAEWLRAYLRIDTTNPPGNEHLAADFLSGILAPHGFVPERILTDNGRTNLALWWGPPATPDRPVMILLHHMDVVPAGGGWTFDPFGGEIVLEKISGRGAIDTKSLGIAHAAAIVRAASTGRTPARPVLFLAVADEEQGGSEGAAWLLEHRPDLFEHVGAVLNEGGGNRALGGEVLWWGIEVAQKGALWLRVTSRGRPGHGSGLNNDSAPHKLVRALAALLELPSEWRVTDPVRLFLSELAEVSGSHWKSIYADIDRHVGPDGPTFNPRPGMERWFLDSMQINVLDAAEQVNVIPESATAEIDLRLLPDSDVEAVLETIRRTVGDDADVEVLLVSPPQPPSPTDVAAYDLLVGTLRNEARAIPLFISGITDSRFFRQAGIPAYGFSPFALDPVDALGIHGPDEGIPTEVFDDGVDRMERVVRAWAFPEPAG